MQPGTQLGHYTILAAIGKGGTGEVWKAHDTKLGREVAIKTLPEEFSKDPVRLARFEREARTLAALNHPNIATIYGIEQATDCTFLAMELVSGETLGARLMRSGKIPLEESIQIATQIAAALEAAQEQGIVHRDLKPGNIMLTSDGIVKVLDFGISKVTRGTVFSDQSVEPTVTTNLTQTGAILGTPAYMSPEQAQGQVVDRRTDIWSFGVILYEMLTGQRMFQGHSTAETLAALMTQQPDLAHVPLQARRTLEWCLERDPKRRLRDIGTASRLLTEPPLVTEEQVKRTAYLASLSWVVAILAVISTIGVIFWPDSRPMPVDDRKVIYSDIAAPESATMVGPHAISPDGNTLAFVATIDGSSWIWVRSLDSPVARRIESTDSADFIFWAPDSRNIGFFASGKLRRVDIESGVTRDLADVPEPRGGSWGSSGNILFGSLRKGIQMVPETGGASVELTTFRPGEEYHFWPAFLPDGVHFLYGIGNAMPGVYVGSTSQAAGQQDRIRLVDVFSNATFVVQTDSSDGHLLFTRSGTLYAQVLDSQTFELSDTEFPVSIDLLDNRDGQSYSRFSVSQNGFLTTFSSFVTASSEISILSRTGELLGIAGIPGPFGTMQLSPDGTRAAIMYRSTSNRILDLERGTLSITPDGPYQAWSPDGSEIAVSNPRTNTMRIYRTPVGGENSVSIEPNAQEGQYVFDWTPQGIVYAQGDAERRNILLLSEMPGSTPQILVSNGAFNFDARVAPDGNWLAYVSDETGTDEVYIQRFPGPGGKQLVSQNGGRMPEWSPDQSELFYVADKKLLRVTIQTQDANLQLGTPQVLIEPVGMGDFRGYRTWALRERNGRLEFLVLRPSEINSQPSIHLTQNWPLLAGQ